MKKVSSILAASIALAAVAAYIPSAGAFECQFGVPTNFVNCNDPAGGNASTRALVDSSGTVWKYTVDLFVPEDPNAPSASASLLNADGSFTRSASGGLCPSAVDQDPDGNPVPDVICAVETTPATIRVLL